MLGEMAEKTIIFNLFVSALLIYGVIGDIIPAKPLPEKLKLPVKTVTTEHGDIYDCIDFFEQPAFDHPLLKNHDYHFDMKPSMMPKQIPDKMKDRFESKKVGCPRGTVPIRRTMGQQFIDSQTPHHSISVYYAGAATKNSTCKIYGASAILSVENPILYEDHQHSSSVVSIGGGNEFLHAGWTVNPTLYGDYNTRFYVWMHGANQSCFNTKCPGFVIANPDYPLDMTLLLANTTGGIRYETKVIIYQDKEKGDWWVVGPDNNHIGFWPKQLFSTLSSGAKRAYYGGAVGVSPEDKAFAQMGMGSCPDDDDTLGNSFNRHISIVNEEGNEEYAGPKSDIFESLNKRYVARNLYLPSYDSKHYWASTILFGGK